MLCLCACVCVFAHVKWQVCTLPKRYRLFITYNHSHGCAPVAGITVSPRRQTEQGYNFRVDDNLKAVGVEHAADVRVELIKLVNRLPGMCIPEHAVAQHKVVGRVEGRFVLTVVIGPTRIIQCQNLSPRWHVVHLHTAHMTGIRV